MIILEFLLLLEIMIHKLSNEISILTCSDTPADIDQFFSIVSLLQTNFPISNSLSHYNNLSPDLFTQFLTIFMKRKAFIKTMALGPETPLPTLHLLRTISNYFGAYCWHVGSSRFLTLWVDFPTIKSGTHRFDLFKQNQINFIEDLQLFVKEGKTLRL